MTPQQVFIGCAVETTSWDLSGAGARFFFGGAIEIIYYSVCICRACSVSVSIRLVFCSKSLNCWVGLILLLVVTDPSSGKQGERHNYFLLLQKLKGIGPRSSCIHDTIQRRFLTGPARKERSKASQSGTRQPQFPPPEHQYPQFATGLNPQKPLNRFVVLSQVVAGKETYSC